MPEAQASESLTSNTLACASGLYKRQFAESDAVHLGFQADFVWRAIELTIRCVMGKKKQKSKSVSKSKSSGGKKKPDPRLRNVAENRKARHRYEILDSVECGMMLMGSEVKSMREGKLSLDEAYIRVKDKELWLIGADIAHYKNAGMWNHDPRRPRKLLVHAREFNSFAGRAHERGLTLIPLRVYFNDRGIAKCVMGLVKGKKLHDKRETLKKRDSDRGLQRAMRRR